MPDSEQAPVSSVLKLLLEKVPGPDGKPWKIKPLAAACEKWLGENVPEDEPSRTFSPAYMYQLRDGRKDNLRRNHIQAICAVMGVPADVFFDTPEGAQVRENLPLLMAIQAKGVTAIAMRASTLDDAGRAKVLELLDLVDAAGKQSDHEK